MTSDDAFALRAVGGYTVGALLTYGILTARQIARGDGVFDPLPLIAAVFWPIALPLLVTHIAAEATGLRLRARRQARDVAAANRAAQARADERVAAAQLRDAERILREAGFDL